MKIAIIGSGNLGTALAGQLTQKGNKVALYTRDKTRFSKVITVYDADTDIEYEYTPYLITESIEEALKDSKLVFITIPSMAIKEFMERANDYFEMGTWICFYPGTGGVEFSSKKLLEKNCVIMGTQRISSVFRLKEYGKYVVTSGKRKELFLGIIGNVDRELVLKTISDLLDIKVSLLPNFLNVTLVPSNPILHPSRLYSIYKNYNGSNTLEKSPLFYEEWDDFASENLIECDKELHLMLDKINLDTSFIIPLLEHYESTNKDELGNKIRSIKSFKGLKSPSLEKDGGFIPDLNNRYFSADFPNGLIIIKAFALICKIDTPRIDEIINWYQNLVNKEYIDIKNNKLGKDSIELPIPQNYGINSIEEIERYYNM